MKYKEGSELYLLLSDKTELVAMSEDRETIEHYWLQIKLFMNAPSERYKIVPVYNQDAINNCLIMYGDSATIQPLSDSILLTEVELKYYGPMFRSFYEDTKTMMKNLLITSEVMNLTIDSKSLITKTFDKYHNMIHSYETFLNSLNPDMIFRYYITEPLLCAGLSDREVETIKDSAFGKIIADRHLKGLRLTEETK